VIDDKCIGCGYCEKACPVQGRAAIEVYSIGEDRIKHGSYITERKKRASGDGRNLPPKTA